MLFKRRFMHGFFFRWLFFSFVYFSAKPITCLYIFGWLRVLCWSIGWLVCWSADGLCVCSDAFSLTHSFVCSVYHPCPHLLTHSGTWPCARVHSLSRARAHSMWVCECVSVRVFVFVYVQILVVLLPMQATAQIPSQHARMHAHKLPFVHIKLPCRTLTHSYSRTYICIRGIRLPMSLVSASNT